MPNTIQPPEKILCYARCVGGGGLDGAVCILRNSDGNRYALYLYRGGDGSRYWNYFWLDNDRNASNPALGLATLFISPDHFLLMVLGSFAVQTGEQPVPAIPQAYLGLMKHGNTRKLQEKILSSLYTTNI